MTTDSIQTVEPGPCPDEVTLRRLLEACPGEGDPSAPEAVHLAGHVDVCRSCQQRLHQWSSDPLIELWLGREPLRRGSVSDPDEAQFLSGLRQQLRKHGLDRLPLERSVPWVESFTSSRTDRSRSRLAPSHTVTVPGYRIERCAGSGGMSTVYEAVDLRLGRRVALKMFRADGEQPHAALERFEREASVLAALNHPNIVPVYEVIQQADAPVLVLEYIAGGSLALWAGGRPLPPAEAARAVATLARALQYAHERGVVHRDLKPSNILLKPRWGIGTPVLPSAGQSPGVVGPTSLQPFELMIADFGLARFRDGLSTLTRTDQPIGTPAYMAPEQIQGGGEPRPAQDLYALGVILYELLTGHPPLLADTLAGTLKLIQEVEPVAPRLLQPGVPPDLETITLKCLEKDPGRRYATAAELASDLERFLAHRPISARPVRWPGRVGRWCRRNPLVAGLTALAAGLLLTLALGGLAAALVQARLRREADTARQQAVAHLDQSLTVYRDVLIELTRVSDSDDPRIQAVRLHCLRSAEQWSAQYLQQLAPDALWTLTDLRMARMLSQVRSFLGQPESARQLIQQTVVQSARLLERQPDRPELVVAAASSLMAEANIAAMRQEYPSAVALLEQGCRLIDEYHQTHPPHEGLMRLNFAMLGNCQAGYQMGGQPEAGIPALETSIALMQRIIQQSPAGAPESQALGSNFQRPAQGPAADYLVLADRYQRLAQARLAQGRWADAESACSQALACLDQVPSDFADAVEAQRLRSQTEACRDQAQRRQPAPES